MLGKYACITGIIAVIMACYTMGVSGGGCDVSWCRGLQGKCGGYDACWCKPTVYGSQCQHRDITGCVRCPDNEACNDSGQCEACSPSCGRNGNCVSTSKGPMCRCNRGWRGYGCDSRGTRPSTETTTIVTTTTDSPGCDPHWCTDARGECGGYKACWCHPARYGHQCENKNATCKHCGADSACDEYGDCEPCSPPCGHGTCRPTSKGPKCKCDHGWKGPGCNRPVPTTESSTAETTTDTTGTTSSHGGHHYGKYKKHGGKKHYTHGAAVGGPKYSTMLLLSAALVLIATIAL